MRRPSPTRRLASPQGSIRRLPDGLDAAKALDGVIVADDSQSLAEGLSYQDAGEGKDVVHLARYFGISYKAMLHRLQQEKRVDPSSPAFEGVKPLALAKALGYPGTRYEFGMRPLPPEERLPRVFVELGYRAAKEELLSPRRVARMLGISDVELEDRLEGEEEETPEAKRLEVYG
jgi:hypothetical protein